MSNWGRFCLGHFEGFWGRTREKLGTDSRKIGDGLEKNWGQTRNPSKCPKQKRPQLDKIKVGDVYAT